MTRATQDSEASAPGFSRSPRCICCGGTIEMSPDQDVAIGLNLTLGLVSDECALICDGCASKLVAARDAATYVGRRR